MSLKQAFRQQNQCWSQGIVPRGILSAFCFWNPSLMWLISFSEPESIIFSAYCCTQTSHKNIRGLKSAATREPRAVGRQSLCESRVSSGSYVGSAKLKAKHTL
ncbi:hypothetical protein XENOCAPTIV_017979 [Xenoophorus captivus]|uniref:Uncharacterized protein n=1 Tax=Xenoophorus captivus TaxID=1517983 RepID=A0ABV0SBU4_9TELE